ncbi:hypothetical protein MMC07_009731 [Pseudocyphellaria aurata]|nr:hypothetical protein [Pseudocyphellaria aurata]
MQPNADSQHALTMRLRPSMSHVKSMLGDDALLLRQMVMRFLDAHLRREFAAAQAGGVNGPRRISPVRLAAAINLLDPTIGQRDFDGDSLRRVRMQHPQDQAFQRRLVQIGENGTAAGELGAGDEPARMSRGESLPARQEFGIILVRVRLVRRRPRVALVHHADQDNGTRPDIKRARIIFP